MIIRPQPGCPTCSLIRYYLQLGSISRHSASNIHKRKHDKQTLRKHQAYRHVPQAIPKGKLISFSPHVPSNTLIPIALSRERGATTSRKKPYTLENLGNQTILKNLTLVSVVIGHRTTLHHPYLERVCAFVTLEAPLRSIKSRSMLAA